MELPENIVNGLRTFRIIAIIIWAGMVTYLLIISGHYIFGFDARQSHDIGIIGSLFASIIIFIHQEKKYKWIDKLESLE